MISSKEKHKVSTIKNEVKPYRTKSNHMYYSICGHYLMIISNKNTHF